jgi:hypothetical protein
MAHVSFGHFLHSVLEAGQSSGYLQNVEEPLQVSWHCLSMQPKVAQLPSAQGVQFGGGSPQSALLAHLGAPHVNFSIVHTPSSSQKGTCPSSHPSVKHSLHGRPQGTPTQLAGFPQTGFEV